LRFQAKPLLADLREHLIDAQCDADEGECLQRGQLTADRERGGQHDQPDDHGLGDNTVDQVAEDRVPQVAARLVAFVGQGRFQRSVIVRAARRPQRGLIRGELDDPHRQLLAGRLDLRHADPRDLRRQPAEQEEQRHRHGQRQPESRLPDPGADQQHDPRGGRDVDRVDHVRDRAG